LGTQLRLRRAAASPAVLSSSISPSGVTRRRLFQTGGAAGAAALFGGQLLATEAHAAARQSADVPDYLIRSSYAHLSVLYFSATATSGRSTPIKLEALEDLTAAEFDRDLRGSEDAFALAFSSAEPLEQGIYNLSHPELGEFDLFIAPVANGAGYEAVVNRSVNAPRHYPRPAGGAASGNGAGGSAAAANNGNESSPRMRAANGRHVKNPLSPVRRVALRRTHRGVVCEVILDPHEHAHSHVKAITAWVERGKRPVATVARSGIHGHRVALRLDSAKRLRSGRYDVTVATTERDGDIAYERVRAVLN
jgi:hypothetical protein